jgi:predicted NACHT family NTPase
MASMLNRRGRAVYLYLSLFCLVLSGCDSGDTGVTETDDKQRLTKVLRLYQVYLEKNKAGPPDEKTLRSFGQALTAQERNEYMIGDDLDSIFTSSRDNQPFVIQYGKKIESGGEPEAIAWEARGVNGLRYVALSIGYVEEYDEETFQQYKK